MSSNDQTIRVTADLPEYTRPVTITETTGKNISAAQVFISLGDYEAPGTWQSGVLERPTAASATIKLLVDSNVTPRPAPYWVWVKVVDSPERPGRRSELRVFVK